MDDFIIPAKTKKELEEQTIRFLKIAVKFTKGGLSFFSILFFIFIFMLFYFSIFLFLEQLGLRLIGHAVTSVTT